MVVILIVGGENSSTQNSSTTVSIVSSGSQVSPEDLTIQKEEEWVTKKKVEVVTKRQIATRVQREVLLEDGKVVQDSGPKVTTTTTEDTQKQESENTEHHDMGNGSGGQDGGRRPLEDEGSAAEVLKEVREKRVTTRQETNETVETEDIKHLGDISDEAYKKAVEGGGNVENWLVLAAGTELASTGSKVVGHTTTKKKIIDTEDTLKKSQLVADGQVVINSSTFKEHEEINEENVPQSGSNQDSDDELRVEKSHHYKKTKDQEFVDYVVDGKQVGREMRYSGEATEAVRLGDAEWDSLSARLRRNRTRLLKEMEEDRKDALTRRPLDFHQEERTRKVETSKWLDHHFGSESASRSSKDSEDDGVPHTSFINVTMKSAKPSRVFLSPADSLQSQPVHGATYFKGVSEWKSRTSPKIDGGIQVLPTGPNHAFNSTPSPPSPKNDTESPSPTSHHRSKSPSPQYNGVVTKFPSLQNLDGVEPGNSHEEENIRTTNYCRHERTTSPFHSSPQYKGHSRSESSPILGNATPTRDYTPPSITPPPRRRHYKQELEAEPAPDYSPPPQPRSQHNTPPPVDTKKKVYQKTRFAADVSATPVGASGGKRGKSGEKRGGLGESFRRLVGRLVGQRSKQGGGALADCGTQTSRDMAAVNRYYLGEDPFTASLYGRESEYPHFRRRTAKDHYRHQSNTSTLGRFSKSTSKLSNDRQQTPPPETSLYYSDRGGVQTLPRKLQEHKAKKQVYVTRSNGESGATSGERFNRLGATNSNSMFNVSIVNNVNSSTPTVGPAKPARTYRSNLLRSKSFNVHAGSVTLRESNRYTSNPHLHRLDESQEPLKSPGLITSISRSSRDLSHDTSDFYRKPLGTFDQNRYVKHNGYTSRSTVDTKKKIFLKGLMDRAPELYKTLHGGSTDLDENKHEPVRTSTPLKNGKLEYSTSFRSNTSSPLDRVNSPNLLTTNTNLYRTSSPDLNRSVIRRGSNDYTQTVSYTTKSDDPLKPSVTNTVQSYTKKTVPMPGGRQEKIESTETKTVTKSKFRTGTPELHFDHSNKYSSSNGGVVIEVRNTRK
ncbi:chascon isoform X2 [Rhodnius prolixus]|uniref:chascon isoform X2 n=1 Tax=Rhodnius prolixus TaxID=13249 RepID=UPI003D18F27E